MANISVILSGWSNFVFIHSILAAPADETIQTIPYETI